MSINTTDSPYIRIRTILLIFGIGKLHARHVEQVLAPQYILESVAWIVCMHPNVSRRKVLPCRQCVRVLEKIPHTLHCRDRLVNQLL